MPSGIRMERLIHLLFRMMASARDTRNYIVMWERSSAHSQRHKWCSIRRWRLSELMSSGDSFPKAISEQDLGRSYFILRELRSCTLKWKCWGILSVIPLPALCAALTHNLHYRPTVFLLGSSQRMHCLEPSCWRSSPALRSLPVRIHLQFLCLT